MATAMKKTKKGSGKGSTAPEGVDAVVATLRKLQGEATAAAAEVAARVSSGAGTVGSAVSAQLGSAQGQLNTLRANVFAAAVGVDKPPATHKGRPSPPAKPIVKPVAKPAVKPVVKPVVKPAAKPVRAPPKGPRPAPGANFFRTQFPRTAAAVEALARRAGEINEKVELFVNNQTAATRTWTASLASRASPSAAAAGRKRAAKKATPVRVVVPPPPPRRKAAAPVAKAPARKARSSLAKKAPKPLLVLAVEAAASAAKEVSKLSAAAAAATVRAANATAVAAHRGADAARNQSIVVLRQWFAEAEGRRQRRLERKAAALAARLKKKGKKAVRPTSAWDTWTWPAAPAVVTGMRCPLRGWVEAADAGPGAGATKRLARAPVPAPLSKKALAELEKAEREAVAAAAALRAERWAMLKVCARVDDDAGSTRPFLSTTHAPHIRVTP